MLRYSSSAMRRPLLVDKEEFKLLSDEAQRALIGFLIGPRMALDIQRIFLRFVDAVGDAVRRVVDAGEVPEQVRQINLSFSHVFF